MGDLAFDDSYLAVAGRFTEVRDRDGVRPASRAARWCVDTQGDSIPRFESVSGLEGVSSVQALIPAEAMGEEQFGESICTRESLLSSLCLI